MATSKRLALAAWRNELFVLTILVPGIDLTAASQAGTLRSQIRLAPDTPGAPLVNLATVSTAAAEGIKLDSVTVTNGVPTSKLIYRINKSTMSSAANLPYTGEIGQASKLAFAIQWDGQTRLYGDFWALASVMDSDGAPTERAPAFGLGSPPAPSSSLTVTVTNGDVVSVAIDGIDAVGALIGKASEQVTLAQAAAADALATRNSFPNYFKGDKGDPGGNVMATGDFAMIASQDIPVGTDLVQTSGATRGQVVADPTFGDTDIAAFPHIVTKSQNARVLRRDEAYLNLREVGLNNDPANNTGAFNEALAYLKRFGNSNSATYRGTPRLRLPPGLIPINRINIKQTVIIEGDGMGHEGANVTILQCGPTGGITVERADTLNGTVVPGETGGGDGTILRGFAMDGGVAAPTGRNDNPGISLKARATLRDMYISRFAGAGVRIVASAGGAGVGELKGNANLWRMQNVTCNQNFDGVYISGDDANAGYGLGVNVNSNVSCGVFDASTLGNTHVAYHSSGNGNNADGKFVMVSSGGKRYAPAWGADDLWSTVQPGTNSNVWKFFENGGPIGAGLPEWYSGIPVKFGAAYATTNRNARAVWVGCYTEGTQAPPQIAWPSFAIGGLFGQVGDGMFLNGEQRAMQALFFRAAGAFLDGEKSALAVEGSNVPTMRLKPDPQGYVALDFGNNVGFRPMHVHGPGTVDARGPNTIEVRNRLGLPGGGAITGWTASATPTDNVSWRAMAFNTARTAATQPVGWTNVPGTTTWIPFGAQSV